MVGRWLNERLARASKAGERAQLLDEARHFDWQAATIFDRLSEPTNAVRARLLLANAEISHGDPDEVDHVLEGAARRLTVDGEANFSESPLLNRLGVLRFRHLLRTASPSEIEQLIPPELLDDRRVEISLIEDLPEEQLRPADPADLLPFAWTRMDATRALRAVESRKSADLLRLLRQRQEEAAESVGEALEHERDIDPRAVRPLERGGLREAFVDYYLREDGAIAFLELPEEPLRCWELDIRPAEVGDAVAWMRTAFDGRGLRLGIDGRRPWRVRLERLDELAARLMPFRSELEAAGIVCFFPHGPLHNFPFHATRGSDGQPLIRHSAIVYGLSRRLLAITRSAQGWEPGISRRPRSALVVSVPSVGEPRPELFGGDAELLRSLGLDVTALATPAEATIERVLEALEGPDLVHLTCHGLFSALHPLDSAFLLSDGREGPRRGFELGAEEQAKGLSAQRLFPRRTSAETAVMRACSSGVTNVRLGDEQEGLLRALLHMGVSTCLVARWKIDVESSRELIRRMYREWLGAKAPVAKAVALQRAELALLEHAEHDHYRHPYHWAPFTLVGDWW